MEDFPREALGTMDSGAGDPVANPDDFPGCVVTESPGSLAGQVYVGPGNEKIPNEGQFVAPMRLEDGRYSKSTYQAARVRKLAKFDSFRLVNAKISLSVR